MDKLEYTQVQLESLKELNVAIKSGSDQEALFMKGQVIKDAEMLTKSCEKLYVQPDDSLNAQFIPVEKYHKWFPQFGNVFYGKAGAVNSEVKGGVPSCTYINEGIEFEIATKNADNKNLYEGGSKVSVEAETSTEDSIPVTIHDWEDGNYSVDFDVKQLGKVKLSVIIEGKHARGSPYSILVCRNYTALDDFLAR